MTSRFARAMPVRAGSYVYRLCPANSRFMVASGRGLSSATRSTKITKRSLTKEARTALIVSSPLVSHRMMRSSPPRS